VVVGRLLVRAYDANETMRHKKQVYSFQGFSEWPQVQV